MSEYRCPHCKNLIYDDEALLCLYCGKSLQRGIGFMGKMKYPGRRVIFVFAIVIIVLSFLLLSMRSY